MKCEQSKFASTTDIYLNQTIMVKLKIKINHLSQYKSQFILEFLIIVTNEAEDDDSNQMIGFNRSLHFSTFSVRLETAKKSLNL
ncbi:hypothetical protein BLOT_015027 [Blomia tropicalis]|nr:hypothetical protein BLOT_015027 [Blomia tropicalis]